MVLQGRSKNKKSWRGWLAAAAGLVILTLTGTFVLAQEGVPQRSISYPVEAMSDSGLSGTLYIGDHGDGLSIVVLALHGTAAGDGHPSHFHVGDCASGGGVEVPLATVDGASGLGVTLLGTGFDDLLAQDYHVNAHRSTSDMGTIVACGEVGTGAQEGAGVASSQAVPMAEAGAAAAGPGATPTPEQEQQGLRSESYQLFALAGSGVNGTLNVTAKVAGGTTFVVTLSGIGAGEEYLPVLFEGDCGPDRTRVTAIPAVGSIANDPFTSISDLEMSYDEVAEGDFFLYIFGAEEQGQPLACGEVGVGANR